MCLNPCTDDAGHTFGCRKCWQCHETKIQDWVGRCIAESKMCTKTLTATLTYGGGDHERAAVLTYSDVQKYFKRLRKAGYKFKYLVAGEYGSLKGRAHWHVVLFFNGKAPPHELDCNYQDPFWTLGHVKWKKPHARSIRYVCKYIQKDVPDDQRQAHFSMSKKPPIGHEYFMRVADDLVSQGLPPQDLKYYFDENRNKEGEKFPHLMQGAIARDFMERFFSQWAAKRPREEIPESKFLLRYRLDRDVQTWVPKLAIRTLDPPDWLPVEGVEYHADHVNCIYYCVVDGIRQEWRKHEGLYTWLSVQGPTDRRSTTSYELDPWLRLAIERRKEDQDLSRRRDPLRLENYHSGRISLPKRHRHWSLPMVGSNSRPLPSKGSRSKTPVPRGPHQNPRHPLG